MSSWEFSCGHKKARDVAGVMGVNLGGSVRGGQRMLWFEDTRSELFIQAIYTSIQLLFNDYSFVVDNRIHKAL
jgi:hypothetical protein